MARRYEIDLTIESASNLKNVNWREGRLNPYVVVWVDPAFKSSTKVAVDSNDEDDNENTNPIWDQKLTIPLPPDQTIENAVLYLDVVHASSNNNSEYKVKPLVGSAKLSLCDVLDEAGIGGKVTRSLKLKRPSGRPHGKIYIKVAIKEPARYYDPYAPPPPAYGQPGPGATSRDYGSYGGAYGQQYGAAPPSGYPYGGAPPSGYPYGGAPAPAAGYGYEYGGVAPPYGAGAPAYGAGAPAYGSGAPSYGAGDPAYGGVVEEKKSKFGMGTGLAVGAVGGLLGGLALAEGIDYVEDSIADQAAEKVEEDLGYDGDDF